MTNEEKMKIDGVVKSLIGKHFRTREDMENTIKSLTGAFDVYTDKKNICVQLNKHDRDEYEIGFKVEDKDFYITE